MVGFPRDPYFFFNLCSVCIPEKLSTGLLYDIVIYALIPYFVPVLYLFLPGCKTTRLISYSTAPSLSIHSTDRKRCIWSVSLSFYFRNLVLYSTYLVTDPKNKEFAMKLQEQNQFSVTESKVLSTMNNTIKNTDNVVVVFASFASGNIAHFLMEYCNHGVSIFNVIQLNFPFF